MMILMMFTALLIGCSTFKPLVITDGCVDTFNFSDETKTWFHKVPQYAAPNLKSDLDRLFKRECKLKFNCYPEEYDKIACEGE